MSRYRYRAARADGDILAGQLTVASESEAVGRLVAQGLHPLLLERVDVSDPRAASASRQDLAVLFRSLASLVGVGVPLDRAAASAASAVSGRLGERLSAIRQSLREGLSLSAAFRREEGLIPARLADMVGAGERASRLGEALHQIAEQLEQEVELLGRVRQALVYPLVLTVTGLASIAVIGFVILPRFAGLLNDLGSDVPWSTRALLAGTSWLQATGPFLPLALAGAIGLVAVILRDPLLSSRLHSLLLEVPVIGPLRHTLASGRWLHSFAAMLSSGLPILAALEAAGQGCGDLAVRSRTKRARERVARGEPITRALGLESVLTPAGTQVLAIGEASGELALMARRAGDLAVSDAGRRLRQLTVLLEPALVLTFGGIVAFVAAALLQAVYSLRLGG